jgi:hypothetical protein
MVTTPVPLSIPVATLEEATMTEADIRAGTKAEIRAKPWPDAVLEHWHLGPIECFRKLGIPHTKYPEFRRKVVFLCQSCSYCRDNLSGAWAITYKDRHDPSNTGRFHAMGTRLPKHTRRRFLEHLQEQEDDGAVYVIPKDAV